MTRMTEQANFEQLKKGQGENNQRLDKLIAEQQRTNLLLEWVGGLLSPKPPAG